MSEQTIIIDGVSRGRQICVRFLCGGVVFFTVLWFAIITLVMLQIEWRVFEGGELIFAGLFLTGFPVAVFTALALLLVGPRRCRVAWISALVYATPFAVWFFESAVYRATK